MQYYSNSNSSGNRSGRGDASTDNDAAETAVDADQIQQYMWNRYAGSDRGRTTFTVANAEQNGSVHGFPSYDRPTDLLAD